MGSVDDKKQIGPFFAKSLLFLEIFRNGDCISVQRVRNELISADWPKCTGIPMKKAVRSP